MTAHQDLRLKQDLGDNTVIEREQKVSFYLQRDNLCS